MTWAANWQPGDEAIEPHPVRPFGEDTLAAGTFSNPVSGFEWLVIITATAAYRVRPGNLSQTIPVVSGQSLAGSVDLVQTYNGLVLLRGETAQPLYLETFDEGFKVPPAASMGYEAIPPLSQAIYMQNRLVGVDARVGVQFSDSFWISNIGGISSVLEGSQAYQSFKINRGSADRLVAGYKFNDLTLLCLKERSVHYVSNIYGTNEEIAANAKLDTVTDEYGCIAPRSVVQVGSDVWFLGHLRGICSVRQTTDNKLQGMDVPKSQDIHGWIERINWEAASGSVAAVSDNKVYFAVPVDGSQVNNAVLVYSTITQSWQSIDTGPAHSIKRWVKFTWSGATRLGFVSTDGFVYCYDHGYMDHTGTSDGVLTYHDIEARLLTRGYGGRSGGVKTFRRWSGRLGAWNPTIAIRSWAAGAFESEEAKTISKDRTKYMRPHGKADYDPLDPADDASQKYREDYSVAVPFCVRAEETGSGFDIMQETEESGRLHVNDESLQLELVCDTGRMEIGGLAVETARGTTRDGTRS